MRQSFLHFLVYACNFLKESYLKKLVVKCLVNRFSERRPKVVSDVFTEPEVDDPETGAKQFNAYDYGDKKLGMKLKSFFII